MTCVSGPLSLVNNLACQKARLWLDGMAANPTDRFWLTIHHSQEPGAGEWLGLGSRLMPRILSLAQQDSFIPSPTKVLGAPTSMSQLEGGKKASLCLSHLTSHLHYKYTSLACAVGMRAFSQRSSTAMHFNLWQQAGAALSSLPTYISRPAGSTALKEFQPTSAHRFHY